VSFSSVLLLVFVTFCDPALLLYTWFSWGMWYWWSPWQSRGHRFDSGMLHPRPPKL